MMYIYIYVQDTKTMESNVISKMILHFFGRPSPGGTGGGSGVGGSDGLQRAHEDGVGGHRGLTRRPGRSTRAAGFGLENGWFYDGLWWFYDGFMVVLWDFMGCTLW